MGHIQVFPEERENVILRYGEVKLENRIGDEKRKEWTN